MLKNPDTIIIQNLYYPNGLTEIQIYNYYQNIKSELILNSLNHDILLFLFTDLNKYIVKRKDENGNNIRLTHENFDRIIAGRVVGINIIVKPILTYICIDIDPGYNTSENDLKICIEKLIILYNKYNNFKYYKIFNSSKGYHFWYFLKQPIKTEKAKDFIYDLLLKENLEHSYNINRKKKDKIINLDFSCINNNGNHPIIKSLNRNGLIYKDITDVWKNYKRSDSILV